MSQTVREVTTLHTELGRTVGHCRWTTGILAVIISLFVSIHLCGRSPYRAMLDVLPEWLEMLSEKPLLPVRR